MTEALKIFIIVMSLSYIIIEIFENNTNNIVKLIAITSSILFFIFGNLTIFLVAGLLIFVLSILSSRKSESNKLLRPKTNFVLPPSK